MDPINPSVIALHGALLELTLRLNRVEERLAPAPTTYRPCSCDESLALRERVRDLEDKLTLLEPIGCAR